jgi:hypothetical protein
MRLGALRVEMKRALVVILAACVLCGCGAAGGTGTQPPTPSPSTGLGLGFDLAVSEKTQAATIRVGQKLEAVLHASAGMAPWNGVRTTDPSVLAPIVHPGATAVRGVTLAAFQGIAPGHAQITATAVAACAPGQACPQYARLLTIDVTVVAG